MIKKLFVSFIRLAILQIFRQAVMRLFFVNNKLVIRLILKINSLIGEIKICTAEFYRHGGNLRNEVLLVKKNLRKGKDNGFA